MKIFLHGCRTEVYKRGTVAIVELEFTTHIRAAVKINPVSVEMPRLKIVM